jgi:ceramide glucosyltransferase
MHPLTAVVLGCAAVGGAYQLFQLYAARRFFRRARQAAPARDSRQPLPPVTVLKPLKGPGVDLYENLVSFCRQEYPRFQIVFGVERADDPAVAVVDQVRRTFPAVDIVLSIGEEAGANRKIANLRHMIRHARHNVLVMSDGDIRVRPDYLRAMVAPLADPAVGLTTTLYRGVARLGLPSEIEALVINTDFMPMVLTAQVVQRFEYAYGASIAFRRQGLDAIGGFAAIANYLADDYQLGNRIARAGYGLVLLPYSVDTVLDSLSFADVWRHQLRWARTYRACQPVNWFATVVTHATTWALLAVPATGGAWFGWATLAAVLALRLGTLAAILRLLGDTETLRHLWRVPLKDLLGSAVWAATWFGHEVRWSGHVLHVEPDGQMVPVINSGHPPAAAEPSPVTHAETERLRAAGS